MVVLSATTGSSIGQSRSLIDSRDKINVSKSTGIATTTTTRTASTTGSSESSGDRNASQSHLFYDHYLELCDKLNCTSFLRVNHQPKYLNRAILSLVTDRLAFADWLPIVQALRADRSLHLIEIKARKQIRTIHEKLDSERKIRLVASDSRGSSATPMASFRGFNFLQTRLVVDGVIEALVNGPISQSNVLTYVCLNGVRLEASDLDRLLVAIEGAGRLQHLSFERCSIGDQGCELIYQRLKNMPSLSSINVAGCGLTQAGVVQLANLIKFQKNQRFCEIWKISLRNRKADLNQMQGLRHLVLNQNPEIGDDGCRELVDVLSDDLWLKSIELQNCGLTNRSNEPIRQLFACNRTLEQFDVRDNRKLSARFSNECFAGAVRAGTADDLSREPGFSSDDSKENSPAVEDNGKTNQVNVVPFRSRYRTDNHDLLNAKRTISSLQQQLKREQSRNERLKIVRRKQRVPAVPVLDSAADEFSVRLDVRTLTEFIRRTVLDKKSFRASEFRAEFKAFIVPIAQSNGRLVERFRFDEHAVLWRPKNVTTNEPGENADSRLESDGLTWPGTYSNFISCDGDNERSDDSADSGRLQSAEYREPVPIRSDSDSFVIKELLKSFQ